MAVAVAVADGMVVAEEPQGLLFHQQDKDSGAASQALKADSKVKLWAMADAFEDRLELGLNSLQKIEEVAPKLDTIPPEEFGLPDRDRHQNVLTYHVAAGTFRVADLLKIADTTGTLDTAAIRAPAHPVAQALIRAAGR